MLLRQRTSDLARNEKARLHHHRKAFDFVDKDKSGFLSQDELHVLFKLLGQPVTAHQIAALIKVAFLYCLAFFFFSLFVIRFSNTKGS
jgi:Ca2+-binding EF-hand superfamily protein